MLNRKLIINADDFGISEATNRAIEELYVSKKITSTSLIANAASADEALLIAKRLNMKVGVHLTLNSDFLALPWKALSIGNSVSDDNNYLLDTAHIAKNAKGRDVESECIAQIQYILDNGVSIDHIDNHSGTMYGINKRAFFIIAFRLSRQYNLPFRFPKSGRFLDEFFNGKTPLVIRFAHKIILFTAKIMRATLIDDMYSNPYKIKDIGSYKELADYYLNVITNLKAGVNELFLHPSYPCNKLSPLTLEWKKRELELEFLHSDALANRLIEEDIKLISYGEV